MRHLPNIVITGTPGVGKTSHCEILAKNTGLKHVSINDIVKEKGCHEGYDSKFKSWIVDEDKVGWISNIDDCGGSSEKADPLVVTGFHRGHDQGGWVYN